MKIAEVMSRKIVTIELTTTLMDAAKKMQAHNIGSLPVVDPVEDKIKGMLTDRDIVVRAVALGKDINKTEAQDAMTETIRYAFEDEDIAHAAEQMKDRQIRRLVILNRDKRLVGIVALSDLVLRTQGEHISAEVVKSVSETAAQHAAH